MLGISMRLAMAIRALVRYAPTNLLLRRLRSRDGLKGRAIHAAWGRLLAGGRFPR